MAVPTIPQPAVLSDPGWLFAAPVATALPANTVVGGVFTDVWTAPWVPLGPTTEGSSFSYSIETDTVNAAEYFDPIKIVTTGRSGSIGFALMDFTLSKVRLAYNGGVGALTATSGTGATALYDYEPVAPGNEVRIMLGWESWDKTMRLVIRQALQGGEVGMDFKKAPSTAAIPVTFNMEMPSSGAAPFKWSSTRG